MASRQELRALITIAGRIDPSLQSAMLRASGESMRLTRNIQSSANSMNRVSTIAKGAFLGDIAARGFTLISSRVTGFAAESIKLASDLNEVQNVVDVTFGKSSTQIDAWSKTALSAFGLSELQAKQFSGTMGAMLKSSGVTGEGMVKMSQNLSGLSGDMASFYNLSQEEAFEKIRSGISGETEPLKQLGINMSVANLEAFAMSKGIKTSYQNMDQASQTMLRYNYLLTVSKDAQGDFNRTQGGYANQVRLFQTNMQQLGATIGQKALPYLTQFLQYANKWAQNIDIGKVTQDVANAFTLMGNGIQWVRDNSNWLIPVVSTLAGAYANYKAVIIATTIAQRAQNIASIASSGYTAAQCAWIEYQTVVAGGGARVMGIITAAQWLWNAAMTANPIGTVVTAISILIGAGVLLWKNWDWVMAKGREFFAWIGKVAEPIKNFFGGGGSNSPDTTSQSLSTFSTADMYASGGIASRPSIFGEDGPEIAIPLQRTPRSIGLLQQAAQMLGVAGPKFAAGGMGNESGLGVASMDSPPRGAGLLQQVKGGISSTPGGVIHITYAPNIQGGNGSEVRRELDAQFEKFKAWCDQYFEDKMRVAYE